MGKHIVMRADNLSVVVHNNKQTHDGRKTKHHHARQSTDSLLHQSESAPDTVPRLERICGGRGEEKGKEVRE